jgi:hypothetical protein
LIPAASLQQSLYVADAIKQGGLTYKDQYIPKW